MIECSLSLSNKVIDSSYIPILWLKYEELTAFFFDIRNIAKLKVWEEVCHCSKSSNRVVLTLSIRLGVITTLTAFF